MKAFLFFFSCVRTKRGNMVPSLYTDVVLLDIWHRKLSWKAFLRRLIKLLLFVSSFFSKHGQARVCERATWSQASLAETVETGDKNRDVTSHAFYVKESFKKD